MAARALIREESRWKFRDGQKIGVSTVDWLLHTPEFVTEATLGLKVRDQIDKDKWQWDRGKIFATLSKDSD